MEEKVEKLVLDIETLKKIKKNTEEEIVRLQSIQNNLEAQAHTAQVKNEQDEKLKNAEIMTRYAEEERRIEEKRLAAESRISLAETLERVNNDRTKEIERREQKTLDLEEKTLDLNNQRMRFEQYKESIEKELAKAQETINNSKELVDKIKADNDMLAGREAKVKVLERQWNDDIGKLEEDKKKFQLEKENVLGLKQIKKEEVDGKVS